MEKKANLQKLLDQVLHSNYGVSVRSKGKIGTVKDGGDEYYFSLSPHSNFCGRMACMVLSKKGGYQLGVSFSKSRAHETFYRNEMHTLTGRNPFYGTTLIDSMRDDILRCAIPETDAATALQIFLNFYDRIKTTL